MINNELKAFEGKIVRVYQGPNYFTGKILGVGEEYITLSLQTNEIMLIKADHIHSISVDVKDNFLFPISENNEDNIDMGFINEKNFYEILQALKYETIKLNDSSESETGIICEVGDDSITVVDKQEVKIIFLNHIKNICIPQSLVNNLQNKSLKKNNLPDVTDNLPEKEIVPKQEPQQQKKNKQAWEKIEISGTTIAYWFL
ncbi:MAG: hypothetical protein ACOYI2_08065 [Bacillota bacterium]|jgi:hypothetical protein|nr:hypothetical protein [Clostridia bacterium]